jgi:hypothetical protein
VKLLLATVLAALAFPAAAFADARLVTEEVPLHGERTLASARPAMFDLVGLHWQGPGQVLFRTRSTTGRWSAWRDAQPEPLDVPDAGTTEAASALRWRLGNPFWVGAATGIQYRTRGQVSRLRAHFVRSPTKAVPVRTLSIASSPPLVSRAAWGANESIRRAGPAFATTLRFAVVHHTAGSNDYTPAQSAAIVRAIQTYHVKGNGWNDLGYNFLVDKYGQVFEGRYGGVERNVVGAHAEGFNTGSVGVALLGSYGDAQPTGQALDAIASLLAWRLDVGHVDPLSRLSWVSGGNARFPTGAPVPLAAVSGHRDTGQTACPGNALYRQLPAIARKAAELGLPKLYDPVVAGRPGAPVRFTARLSSPRPWTVSVQDAAGTTVATANGDGQSVDWTWDATAAPQGRYTYAIDAGADVRPATGAVGGTTTAGLAVTGAAAKPATFTPNGDGRTESTVISYTLSQDALVTGTLRNAAGQTVATLFHEQRRAGRQVHRFTAAGVPDGSYVVSVSAQSAGRTSRVEVPVVVDRTLAGFTAAPALFSPNGDGRLDQVTFAFALSAPAAVRVSVGKAVVFEGPLDAGQHRLPWAGPVRDGKHAAVVEATGPLGRRAQTARFAVDTTRPRLRLLSRPNRRLWASEPGTLVFVANGRRFEVAVKAGRFTAPAGGKVRAVLWDGAGNKSATLHYG